VLNDPTVRAVAAAHNTSAAAVALRWVTQQGIVAVTSSDKPSHVAGDLASFSFNLTDAEMAQLANVV
jgi:diketogulonate reductase-like aldo/keto reductase